MQMDLKHLVTLVKEMQINISAAMPFFTYEPVKR